LIKVQAIDDRAQCAYAVLAPDPRTELSMVSSPGGYSQQRMGDQLDNGSTGAPTEQNGHALTAEEFGRHFLALAQVRGIGLKALHALTEQYSDLSQVWEQDATLVAAVLSNAHVPGSAELAKTITSNARVLLGEGERDRQYLARRGIQVLYKTDPAFPARLREIADSPAWLFVEGNTEVLHVPSLVAVVGTRKATKSGLKAAKQLSWEIANSGLGIISGLAEGIDAEAHELASNYDVPQVAVLGTGINVVFPASTSHLRGRIVEGGGAIVSEYLPAENYGQAKFVQRNRIQAGLSVAVCPVEGKAQSGTAHTIRFAEKYGRRLFGVTRNGAAQENSNEILGVLKEIGAPIFDIGEDIGRRDLKEFLIGLPGPRVPFKRPDLEYLYRRLIKAWEDFEHYDDAPDYEKKELVRRFARRLGLKDWPPEPEHVR
jgi:DNA protecting protein DprA